MTGEHYIIRGGHEGRERLRLLARVMWPTTEALLRRITIAPDARCHDVGCGGGDVTRELARLVPRGRVVGSDTDPVKVELARSEAAALGMTNVEFRVGDVMRPPPPEDAGVHDVVYARFLLTHLPDPATAVSRMLGQLAPGGTLIVEDIDFSGHFCLPDSTAFRRYVELFTATVRARGGDANIGPRLPGLLRAAGLTGMAMNVVQPAGFDGDVKLIAPITMEAVADAVVQTGCASREEVKEIVAELYESARDDAVVSVPRIVQVWGRRSA